MGSEKLVIDMDVTIHELAVRAKAALLNSSLPSIFSISIST
jgi:hypothetical protein